MKEADVRPMFFGAVLAACLGMGLALLAFWSIMGDEQRARKAGAPIVRDRQGRETVVYAASVRSKVLFTLTLLAVLGAFGFVALASTGGSQ
jgi:hypothetical protein